MARQLTLDLAPAAFLATGVGGALVLSAGGALHWDVSLLSLAGLYAILGGSIFFRGPQAAPPLAEQKRINDEAFEALEYKASLERILNAISLALMEANSVAGFDTAVNAGLCRIGEFACVDRAYLFLVAEDHESLHYSHEWCAPAINSQRERFQGLRVSSFPWLFTTLQDQDHLLISTDHGFPPIADMERKIFGQQHNQAMILVPIRARKSLLGFIGFDFVAQPWIDEDIDLLRTLSNILGSAIARIRADAELVEREQRLMVYRDQLKSLMKELTLAEERERRKVAKDLHDQIGQMLAVVKIKQKKLAQTLVDADPRSLSHEIIEMLDQILKDVRSLTFELSGLAVFRDDLNAALDGLGARALTEHGIAFTFRAEGEPFEVPEHVRTILYQVVRELFYNVIKHAKARAVETVVLWSSQALQVWVADDGQGFVSAATKDLAQHDHFGLFNIRERVDSLGGSFVITSVPGNGTKAEVRIPVSSGREPIAGNQQNDQ